MSAKDSNQDIVDVHLDDFGGGVGLWGAVPAGYDTTRLPMDRGIHVHARRKAGKHKDLDRTHTKVRLLSSRLPRDGIVVSELEAIYYMVSTVFGITPRNIVCSTCGSPHLDQDWYSVHPHNEHPCGNCGNIMITEDRTVGNPIVTVRNLCGVPTQKIRYSEKQLDIRQADYRNGILTWGSNPAFLWTGKHAEQEGMHVHVFGESAGVPELDETYGSVQIDGVVVDPYMVRLHMAQQSLPSLHARIDVVFCPECRASQFDTGESAYSPTACRICSTCGTGFTLDREVVSNPILATFDYLGQFAQRAPQHYPLNLPMVRPAAA